MRFCPVKKLSRQSTSLRLSAALCEFYLPRLEKWLSAVGPYIDVIAFGDESFTQMGTEKTCSPGYQNALDKTFHMIPCQ